MIGKRPARMILSLALLVALASISSAQDNEVPGASGGSSPGSSGMDDTEAEHLSIVRQSEKKGKTSRDYIGSLLGLGMHYNRHERFAQAARTLRQALSIIDAGALKPTPDKDRKPERIVEQHHPGGVVSAQVIRTPMPYEETLQELLPQLITAEIGANELAPAEAHIKRLIALAGPNEVADKLALMSAYSQYAELRRKQHRDKEAEQFQRKADEISRSFKPL